jgi:tetratricopeptide (TPR) repeat protein
MAQVNGQQGRTLRIALVVTGLIGWLGMATAHANEASPPIPEPALRAEMQQDWQQAARLYREALATDPQRIDLWRRLADVLAADGQAVTAAEVLTEASRVADDDAELAMDAARAWAQADEPGKALERCEHAATLRPEDTEILETCALQANWFSNTAAAAHYYERIYALEPADDVLRRLARAKGGAGELDQSVRLYRRYFENNPDDTESLLEYATVQTWRGDYAAAHDALDHYRELAGEDDAWRARMARLLAWANRPTRARFYNDTLLTDDPDNYEHLYTRMLILRADQRPSEAIASLEPLKTLRPESKDTLDAIRSTHAFLRSNIGLGAAYRNDSDDIRIRQINMNGPLGTEPGNGYSRPAWL